MSRFALPRRVLGSERGSVIPLVCVMMMALLGMLAFAVDIGNAYLHKRRLQAAVDLALVSAAQRLPNGAVAINDAGRYIDANWVKRDPSKVTSDAWTECTTPDPITGCTKPDLLHVSASVEVPTFFAKLFGVNKWKLKAKGSACGPCDTSTKKFDVMVVLDRSYSMCLSSTGAPNGCADINNARDGIKSLLGFFNPQFDRVGLTLLSSGDDVNPNSFHTGGPAPRCDSADIADGSAGKGMFYRTLGDFMDGTKSSHDTWVVAPLASDFKNSDDSLNTSSGIVSTLDCLQHKYWTPIAPAISEATDALLQGRGNAQKILVFMGDGGANVQPMQRDANGKVVVDSNGVQQFSWYTPSPGNNLRPCHDAVGQANRAKNAGIEIYSIGYDLNAGGAQTCYTNNTQSAATVEQGIDARETMRQMATDDDHFYEKASAGQVYTIFNKIGREIVGTGVRLTE